MLSFIACPSRWPIEYGYLDCDLFRHLHQAVEAYGIFCIGEMIGRVSGFIHVMELFGIDGFVPGIVQRNLVGYKLKEQ